MASPHDRWRSRPPESSPHPASTQAVPGWSAIRKLTPRITWRNHNRKILDARWTIREQSLGIPVGPGNIDTGVELVTARSTGSSGSNSAAMNSMIISYRIFPNGECHARTLFRQTLERLASPILRRSHSQYSMSLRSSLILRKTSHDQYATMA